MTDPAPRFGAQRLKKQDGTPADSRHPDHHPTDPQPAQPSSEGWLTPAEGAAYLRVNTRTLLSWARLGKVRGHTLSGTKRHVWRFRRSDLDLALRSTDTANEGVVDYARPSVLSERRRDEKSTA